MKNSKKDTFPVGTIVLQYISDGSFCVGIVVGQHMYSRVSSAYLSDYSSEMEYSHILLVLGHMSTFSGFSEIFWEGSNFSFPTYILGEVATATPEALKNEIAFLKRHAKNKPSRGLASLNLQSQIFGFNSQQKEALQLVVLVKHFINGGNLENLPDWILLDSLIPSILFNELKIACGI